MKYIKGLDTLRAFAVFFVLIEHKGIWFDDTVPNGRFIKEVLIPDGAFGVNLFFVLSGFLITTILLDQRKQDNNGPFSIVRSFFARRALRIFPIYFLLLLFLYVINYPGFTENIIYHLTYTTNILCYSTNQWNSFSHVWTLCIEEQFYLLWPWLIIFVPEKHLRHVFLLSILIGVTSTWYCMALKGHMAPLLVSNCFDSFGIGGLFAYSLIHEESRKQFQQWLKWLGRIAICAYLYWKLGAFFHIATHGIVFSKTVNSVLSVRLISAVVNAKPSAFHRYFLENSFFTFVGKISYGIYLYHYVYNGLVYYQLNDYLNRITAGYASLNHLVRDQHFYYWLHVALVIALSACSYYVVERPFLRLKRFFGYNKEFQLDLSRTK
jgi:peptidoglycan/LPS O-acetylase OafA/YrhL